MTLRPRVITALALKDFRVLWPAMALVGALFLAQALLWSPHYFYMPWSNLKPVLQVLGFAGAVVVTILAIMQDPAISVRHDWLTRPTGRLEIVLSKYLVLAAGVVAPIILSQIIEGMVAGRSLGEIAVRHLSWYSLLLALPLVMGIAATARNLISLLIVMVTAGLACVFIVVTVSAVMMAGTVSATLNWIGLALMFPVALGLGAVLLWLTYGLRQANISRGAVLAATAATTLFVFTGPPYALLWRAHAAVLPETETSRAISLAFEPGCFERAPQSHFVGHPGEPVEVLPKLRFEGVPEGALLHLAGGAETYVDPDGKVVFAHYFGGRSGSQRSFQGRVLGAPDNSFHMTAEFAQRLMDQKALMRKRYDVTLLEPTGVYEFQTDRRRHKLPGFGYCSGFMGLVDCFSPGNQADLVAIERIPRIDGDDATVYGVPNFTPRIFELSGRHYTGQAGLQFGNVEQPVGVRVTTYRATARFQREIESTHVLGNAVGTCSLDTLPVAESRYPNL